MALTVQDKHDLRSARNIRLAQLVISTLIAAAPLGVARAEPGATLNQYRAPASSDDGFATSRPDAGKHLHFETRLSLDYARDPLVYETRRSNAKSEQVALVSDQLTAQLGVSFGVLDRLLFFASLPVNLVMEGTPYGLQPTATGFGAGDLGGGARAVLLNGSVCALALELAGTVPTGAGAKGKPAVAGDASGVFSPALLGEMVLGSLRVTANVGLRFRKTIDLPGVSFGNQLTYALALSVPLAGELLRGQAELFGATLTSDAGVRASTPLEALLGLALRPSSAITLGFAGGMGFLRGYGAPDLRLIAQLAWHTPGQASATPAEPVPVSATTSTPLPAATTSVVSDEVEAPVDLDQDGVPDAEDACPPLPGSPQLAGCPEQVSYIAATGALTLMPAPSFARTSAKLDPRSVGGLEDLAATLAKIPSLRVLFAAHLDPKTSADLVALSEERARALSSWLMAHGVAAKQLEPYGCAATRPISARKADRAQNERVEFYLVRPLPEQGMPSTLRCTPVALPLLAADAPATSASAAPAHVANDLAGLLATIAQNPTADEDRDGVKNRDDHCPLDPGSPSDAGCSKDVHVDLDAGRMVLLRALKFEGKAFKSRHDSALRTAIQILEQHPAWRIRIESYTAEGSDAPQRTRLSRDRASAVRHWMNAQGIDAERMEAYGCGGSSPLTSDALPKTQTQNERIDLVLLDPAPKSGVPLREGCVSSE